MVYLRAVLGLGHGYQKLEDGLRLGHQRGDGVDDRCELGVRFNTWRNKEEKKKRKKKLNQKDGWLMGFRKQLCHTSGSRSLSPTNISEVLLSFL